MKRTLLLYLIAILFPLCAVAEDRIGTYATAETFQFELRDLANVNQFVHGVICSTAGSGDVQLICDGAAAVEATNCFVTEDKGYSLTLTAAEKRCMNLSVYIEHQTDLVWADKVLHIAQTLTGPTGTAASGAVDSIVLEAGASAVSDYYNGIEIAVIDGTGSGQVKCICDYDGPGREVTPCTDFVTAPDNTSKYAIQLRACTTVVDAALAADVAAIKLQTDQFAFTGSEVSCRVESMADDVITEAATDPDFSTMLAVFNARTSTATIEAATYDGLEALSCRSMIGATSRQTHRNVISGGVWTTYQTDDTTPLCAMPITSDANAAPIIGVGP